MMPRKCGCVSSSLRAERSNPDWFGGCGLDCFVASLLAMTEKLFDNEHRSEISPRRLIDERARFQPFLLGALQRACSIGAGLAELRGLLWIACKNIRQRQRGVDLGDDATDTLDLGLGLGDALSGRLLARIPGAFGLLASLTAFAAVTGRRALAPRRQHQPLVVAEVAVKTRHGLVGHHPEPVGAGLDQV